MTNNNNLTNLLIRSDNVIVEFLALLIILQFKSNLNDSLIEKLKIKTTSLMRIGHTTKKEFSKEEQRISPKKKNKLN
jgi:hypothetical protein